MSNMLPFLLGWRELYLTCSKDEQAWEGTTPSTYENFYQFTGLTNCQRYATGSNDHDQCSDCEYVYYQSENENKDGVKYCYMFKTCDNFRFTHSEGTHYGYYPRKEAWNRIILPDLFLTLFLPNLNKFL